MNRREFVKLAAGVAMTWPFAAHAQQPEMPVIGYLTPKTAEAGADDVAAFRDGLQAIGFVDGRNVAIEYRWETTNTVGFRRWRPISWRARSR